MQHAFEKARSRDGPTTNPETQTMAEINEKLAQQDDTTTVDPRKMRRLIIDVQHMHEARVDPSWGPGLKREGTPIEGTIEERQ